MPKTQDEAAVTEPQADFDLKAEIERLTTLLAVETDTNTRLVADLDAARGLIASLQDELAEARPAPKPAVHPDFPHGVKLLLPHGFIEEETGRHRFWKAGEIVTDPAEAALLIGRGAALSHP